MKIVILLLLLFVLPFSSQAEDSPTVDWYIAEAEKAVDSERYEYAVKVLMEGQAEYPRLPVFSEMLGDLYFDKELYSLALKEYKAARERAPEDYDILFAVATTEGMLNRDLASVSTLEEILRLYPDSLDVIIDLGWMYFKTFQLGKGEEILSRALETYGPVPGLSMTLGTVYSGMYEYEKAKKHYQDSIDGALEAGREYFASVAYYNLSLLEQNFYRYNDALEATRSSLQMVERAPGHIALGELYQLKADYMHAKEEYEKAFALDTTPLAMMNLADLHYEFGTPDQALAYLEEVAGAEDTSWMFYFGTDLKRHRLDLHRVYKDIYESLAFKWMKEPGRGLKRVGYLLRGLAYKALSWYHGRKYQSLSLEVGMSYLEEGNVLDANWFFYKGNSDYEKIALKYLSRAEKFEVSMAPEAEPYYLLERGKLLSDADLLWNARMELEGEWEKSGVVETLACLAPLVSKSSAKDAAPLLRELYQINRGAFFRYGISLPVYLEGDIPGSMVRMLNRSWFSVRKNREEAACILSFFRTDEGATGVKLLHPESEKVYSSLISDFLPSKRKEQGSLTDELIAKVFFFD